jgi:16S rRNA (uracil1498-N3)-methyltransferase
MTEKKRQFRAQRSQRFFLPKDAFNLTSSLAASEDAALVHQISHVLRMSEGDGVLLLDGQGQLFEATIARLKRSRVEFQIVSLKTSATAASALACADDRIISVLPMIKTARLEWALEKLTEAGVSTIQPMTCERSQVKLQKSEGRDDQDPGKKRWHHIVQEAAEQCERLTLPELLPPCELADLLLSFGPTAGADIRLLLSERSQAPDMVSHLYNPDRKQSPRSITILSGPEGGFTDAEKADIEACGFVPVSLGKTILRAETAAIIGAAIASLYLGQSKN